MVLSLLIFLAVTIGLLGLFHFLPRYAQPDKVKVRQRLAEERQANRPEGPVPRALFQDLDVLSLSSPEEYALLGGDGQSLPRSPWRDWRKRLDELVQQAHVSWQLHHFVHLALVSAGVLGLTGTWLVGWVGTLVGCLLGLAWPFVFLNWRGQMRRNKLLNQLPSAFLLMARVIRAGQSVPQSLQAVAEAFEEPLAGEFNRCQQQEKLGLSPEVVFQEMARRSGILEMRIFVMAVLVQRQTGGNLSEVLDRLAGLVRDRLRLRQQVRTLTAEGRLQGLTLLVLPFVMFTAMFFLNRQYALVLLNHPGLLWTTAGLMGVGVLWIRKIVNIEG